MRVEIIRSGQPRAYADSERVVRLHFDEEVTEAEAREAAENSYSGYTGVTKDNRDGWWSSYLDYFIQIDPLVWEFRVVTPYTD